MPELPEVETVKETLKRQVLNEKIISCNIYYSKLIEYPTNEEFLKKIVNEKILNINRRGKWIVFELTNYYLLSHLRMEGKYFIRKVNDEIGKHDLLAFNFSSGISLRYNDVRKFGKMHLIEKDKLYKRKPFNGLGLEPFSEDLDVNYMKNRFKKITKPIKTTLLDQSIIVGIGNIYADEILFLSKINPLKKTNNLTDVDLQNIINNTRLILKKAILQGGTTIRSYTSSEGVHGKFQNELLVHTKEICPECSKKIEKIRVGGRGTYFCPNCQK